MTAQLLSGQPVADQVYAEIAQRIVEMRAAGVTPGLGTILVGDDGASAGYVRKKHETCEQVGLRSFHADVPAEAGQAGLLAAVDEMNANPEVDGYIIQHPVPPGFGFNAALERMSPAKDADGLHPTNLGRLVLNVNGPMTSPLPCTPRGIVELLERYGVGLAGAEVCVIGRGVTVGRPLGLLLTRRSVNATVTLCHTGTKDVAEHVRRADVVVAAAGVPGVVTASMVKPGAAVLDVGITRVLDEATGRTRLVGDVAPDVHEVAAWVAPMPGGVGPMTRAMLLSNVVEAAERA